jgi:hypothetical protein
MTKFFLNRSHTQYFMTENDRVFLSRSGEVEPKIWWVKFSRRTRTPILMSTISLGEVVPNFLGKISPGYDFSRSPISYLWEREITLSLKNIQRNQLPLFVYVVNLSFSKNWCIKGFYCSPFLVWTMDFFLVSILLSVCLIRFDLILSKLQCSFRMVNYKCNI